MNEYKSQVFNKFGKSPSDVIKLYLSVYKTETTFDKWWFLQRLCAPLNVEDLINIAFNWNYEVSIYNMEKAIKIVPFGEVVSSKAFQFIDGSLYLAQCSP